MLPKIKEESVIGFGDAEDPSESNVRKKTYAAKKSGGFQSMGLSFPVLKGIQKRGYKIPTPIQRKTIPLITEGRDVVAMARTGSGKTACFLIPLFEKLKTHSNKGTRALILSPTRELAVQTLRFLKELGKYTGLRSAVVLGGDAMESQFSALHNSPDVIVATPGRFLHICVEMELKLNSVQYIVFDEADRLFENGFEEQLREIIQRLPETRQTVLFSATLPKVLVEFARAGLSDPVLLRLDVETKIPETLQLSFINCRPEEKPAVLICLLKHVVKNNSLTLVFAATKHHVEYLHVLLEKSGIPNSYIYSDLDPSARKLNVAKFQSKKVNVMVVTDVAARGIDIPHLDYVINYNFPAKAKLFVHRVGRCARAGREGRAICMVSGDELCYLIDLHLFLGRPLTLAPPGGSTADDGALGKVPQSLLEPELSEIVTWHNGETDLASLLKVTNNSYKQYIRSRPGASTASVKRTKELDIASIGDHFLFKNALTKDHETRANLIVGISNYRPKGTIFEVGSSSSTETYNVMKTKRKKHTSNISLHQQKVKERMEEKNALNKKPALKLELSNPEDIGSTFSSMILGKRKSGFDKLTGTKKLKKNIDKENFIPYVPSDKHTEEGLAVNNFQKDASAVGLDLTGDSETVMKSARMKKVWDKKKRRMVGVKGESKESKIKSESGAWIPATYKSGRYQQWMERTKSGAGQSDESDGEEVQQPKKLKRQPNTHWAKHNMKVALKKKLELKRPEQIVKAREQLEKKRKRHGRHKKKKKH